jgi:hypothetical protein
VALRAVCGVANPRNSTAIAAVLRLASHPAKPLSRREEIANTFLQAQHKNAASPAAFFMKTGKAAIWQQNPVHSMD